MASINYWLVMPYSEQTTLFQGFSVAVAQPRFLNLLAFAPLLPHDTSELFLEHKDFLEQRSECASLGVAALGEQVLDHLPEIIESGINVVLCLSEMVPALKLMTFDKDVYLLIVSDLAEEGVVDVRSLPDIHPCNRLDAALYELVRRVAVQISGDGDNTETPKLRSPYNEPSKLKFRNGGVTLANELVMMSLGFVPEKIEYLDASNPQDYIDSVAISAEFVMQTSNPRQDMRQEAVIYVPAIYGPLYNINKNFWNQILRRVKVGWHRDFIKKGLVRNPWYSNVIVEDNRISERDNPHNDPAVSLVLSQRQRELLITNLAVASLAAAETLPVFRLPNSVNLSFPKFKEIERIYQRNDERSGMLLQQRFKELNVDLKANWGEKLGELISKGVDSLKICSDVPLEWVYLKELPLMITHEVSKIPMTPGNFFLQNTLVGGRAFIPEEILREVLIIRSFGAVDPIRTMLQTSIEFYKVKDKISIKFVDVGTVEEVVNALNNFDKAIVIFDCHGGHDGDNKPGWLKIGNEKLDTWELAGRARVPPIVLLSACSTSAIGGSHASVANGLLRSGARSVVGTFLPVDARSSSVFMARILYRIHSFLPALKTLKIDSISWRSFMTGFFRMSFATDVLHMFRDERGLITDEQYMKIHMEANMNINSMDDRWYDKLIESVSRHSGLDAADLVNLVCGEKPLMETMLYCQVGRPELLVIVLDGYGTSESTPLGHC